MIKTPELKRQLPQQILAGMVLLAGKIFLSATERSPLFVHKIVERVPLVIGISKS